MTAAASDNDNAAGGDPRRRPGADHGGSPMSEASHVRFREVVQPHLGDALAFARGLTGNMADAEDVVQEACVKALSGIDGYAGGNARAWLLTIVRHAAFTWLARNRPKNLVLVGETEALAEVENPSDAARNALADGPEAALIAKADAAALEAAIATLAPPFREILVLRDINELSYRDIAAMLAIPIGTVMSRLSRARGLVLAELQRNP
jgi:RNA polymerase sigma factor (sigma-70 family)